MSNSGITISAEQIATAFLNLVFNRSILSLSLIFENTGILFRSCFVRIVSSTYSISLATISNDSSLTLNLIEFPISNVGA